MMQCLLCYNPKPPEAGTLLGMPICKGCEEQLRKSKLFAWVGVHSPVIDKGILRWAIMVHQVMNAEMLDSCELWLAKRMALAGLMGLEVDLADLRITPALEWDLCGMDCLPPAVSGG